MQFCLFFKGKMRLGDLVSRLVKENVYKLRKLVQLQRALYLIFSIIVMWLTKVTK